MKKIVIIVGLLFCSAAVSAGDDDYYVITYEEEKPKATASQALELKEEEATQSESIIQDDLDKISHEIKSLKNQMYKEIHQFKYRF